MAFAPPEDHGCPAATSESPDAGCGSWWAVVGHGGIRGKGKLSKFFKFMCQGVRDLWRPWPFKLDQAQLGVLRSALNRLNQKYEKY